MKTIGLLGGMSWESTVTYYRIINETIRERLGGLHSAKIVLYSVDFHEIERLVIGTNPGSAWLKRRNGCKRPARTSSSCARIPCTGSHPPSRPPPRFPCSTSPT